MGALLRNSIGAAILAAALLTAGCSSLGPAVSTPHSPATTAASQVPGQAGVPVLFQFDNGSTGQATVWTTEWQPGSGHTTPKYGAFLVLDVTIEGVTGVVSASPLYWSARDAQGRNYDASPFGLDTAAPQLGVAHLNPGDQARGFVVIDMPRGPATIQLSNPMVDVVGTWLVPG